MKACQALPLGEPSKLVGVHVSPIAISYGMATDVALASYIEAQMEAAEAERKSSEVAFRAACERAGIAYE